MSRYLKVFWNLGFIFIITAIFMLFPVICALCYREYSEILKFIIPSLIYSALGALILFFTRKYKKTDVGIKTSAVTVVLSWIIAVIIGSVPFMFSNLSFTKAIFESVSGWTTTGLTMYADVEAVSKAVLLWRSLTHFLGGIGIILVLQLIIPGNQITMLYQAEGHGERVLPNIRKNVKLIIGIYCIYIALGTILYLIGKMSFFDAINHSMSAMATGGFSTRNNSIGAFNSVYIECVTIFLMLLGSINFAVHILLFTRQFKRITKIFELKVMCLVLIIFIPLISFVGIGSSMHGGLKFRTGVFDTISTMTSTGFTIQNSAGTWSGFKMICLVFLMLIGGNLGSTAGGIKQYRIGIALKSFYWNITKRLKEENKVYQPYIYNSSEKMYLSEDDISKNNTLILMILGVWLAGSLLTAAAGFTMEQSFFEFASIVGNTGLTTGISITAPGPVLWVMLLGMLLGRLEVIIVFVAFGKIFKDFSKRVQRIKFRKEQEKNQP